MSSVFYLNYATRRLLIQARQHTAKAECYEHIDMSSAAQTSLALARASTAAALHTARDPSRVMPLILPPYLRNASESAGNA